MMSNRILENRLKPILKWAGGKEQELKYIHPALPNSFNNYYEPFIGGGAVFFSIKTDTYFVNDKSEELIVLYKLIKAQDKLFFEVVEEITKNWNLLEKILANHNKDFIDLYTNFSKNIINEADIKKWVLEFTHKNSIEFNGMLETNFNINIENFLAEIKKSLVSKIKRMKKIETEKGKLPNDDIVDNLEGALKSAFYTHFRYLYNNIEKYKIEKSKEIAIFFFIRNFAYSGMFRYNKDGKFNVPYGGIGYNRKNLDKKIEYLKSKELIEHLNNTEIFNLDFEEFFKTVKPLKNDFIFLDPPYDSEFSTYAKNEFTQDDQKRLANYLLKDCEAKWMLVIKNTEFIFELYNQPNINISDFDKQYLVNIKNRNDKNAKHLIIKNY